VISFDEAFKLACAAAPPLGPETIALAEAHGRVLAEQVTAGVSSPPCDMSAMDGYAVREADLGSLPARLHITSEIFAGSANPGAIDQGECARIFTGAPVPKGADRVIVQEVAERDGDYAQFSKPLSNNSNIRKCGNDFGAGDILLKAGRKLDYRALVAAAGGDVAKLTCWRKPRVALLATGDELAEPGTARHNAGTIPESISVGIAAMVREFGGQIVSQSQLPDDLDQMERAATSAVEYADLVITTGGASVGDRDFAKQMFAPAGLEMIFTKVAIKPGKPVWLGRAMGKLVLGLPGNPTSAMVTGRLFLAALITGLAGADPLASLPWRGAEIASSLPAAGDRETFVRASLDAQGRAVPLGNQFSSAQHALANADLLLRRPAGLGPLEAGEIVPAISF